MRNDVYELEKGGDRDRDSNVEVQDRRDGRLQEVFGGGVSSAFRENLVRSNNLCREATKGGCN